MGLRIGIAIGLVAVVGFALAQHDRRDEAVAKSSPCGPAVGEQPGKLGLRRTRGLILCLLNVERARAGLVPLRRNAQLELASQRHSRDMATRKFFEHSSPEGIDPQQRMLAAGYRSDNASSGENIAWGTGPKATPAAIVDLWMHSPPHREDILRPAYVDVGVGMAPGAPETPHSSDPAATYTTDFGGPPQL